MGRWQYAGCLGILLSCITHVHAQGQTTRAALSPDDYRRGNAALEVGKDAYTSGRYDEALHAFEASYEAMPEPRTLYRIADAADKLGWHERAVRAFQLYLERVPHAKDRAFIESRIIANQAVIESAGPATTALADARAPETAFRGGDRVTSDSRPWWLWVGAGALVVAGVTVAAVLLGNASPSTPAPVRGNVGSSIQTLHGP